MFTEFLHPELVLFGNFLDANQGCKHHVELKDGQITVHQLINRAPPTVPEDKIEIQNDEEYELDEDEEEYLKREEEYYKDHDEGDEDYEDEEEEMMHGYYQDEQNPYDEGYYAYNIAGQYSPEQLNALLANSKKATPPKNDNIPFSKEKKREQEQQQNEDEEWQTEEQEQDYVTNQLLEEAGGNFAAEL